MTPLRHRRRLAAITVAAASALFALAGCAAPAAPDTAEFADWDAVLSAAKGQTVQLWMYGGDDQGNAYIDDVLAPAVAEYGVTLERVPVTDTRDALNRVFTELQAGREDGSVDLVWVNGDNFRTGKEAGAWRCGWTGMLPSMANTSADDPLLQSDFGTPVDGCEAPWHKAQFTLAYNAEAIPDPPTTLAGCSIGPPPTPAGSPTRAAGLHRLGLRARGARERVGRSRRGAHGLLAGRLRRAVARPVERLDTLAPNLWRGGDTYPANETELGQLFADRQVDMTMTYGPATLTGLVADGTYPAQTKVLTLEDGTVGNASFLGLPVNSDAAAGAMVVANVALSAEQQAKKAEPDVWGQFPVLDLNALSAEDRALFDALPASPVVPAYDVLSRNAHGELAAEWVPALDDGWRQNVLSR